MSEHSPGRGVATNRPALTAVKHHGVRIVEAVIAAVAFILLLQWILGYSLWDRQFWDLFVPAFVRGLVGTAYYTGIVIPLGLLIGFLWGWGRLSNLRLVRWPIIALIEFFRGIPPIVLMLFAFLFGLALIPRQADPFQSALLVAAVALSLHTASYQAEIFRAGFQSVPRGQVEAAQAVGMNGGQVMTRVILPQALRLSLPPLGNEFATVIKDTSLLGAIGAVELFAIGLEFSQRAPLLGQLPWVFAIWTSVAAAYFVITFLVTRGLRFLEYVIRTPGLEGVRA